MKTGGETLNINDYSDHEHKVFLFQSGEHYEGPNAENVTCITRDELLNFMEQNTVLLPKSIQNKLDMLG